MYTVVCDYQPPCFNISVTGCVSEMSKKRPGLVSTHVDVAILLGIGCYANMAGFSGSLHWGICSSLERPVCEIRCI